MFLYLIRLLGINRRNIMAGLAYRKQALREKHRAEAAEEALEAAAEAAEAAEEAAEEAEEAEEDD